MAAHPQLAVLSQSGCAVTFFDLSTHEPLGRTEVLPQGHELRFDPRRRLLYASHTYRDGYYLKHSAKAHEITVIDVATREIARVIDLAPEHAPHELQLGDDGLLYVSVEAGDAGNGAIVVVDPDTGEQLARHDAGAAMPHWAAVTRDTRTAYTTNKQAPHVSVLDLRDGAPARRISVTGSEGLALSADERTLFVATPTLFTENAEPEIVVVDTATEKIAHRIPLAHLPGPVHVTAAGALLTGQWRRTGGESDAVALSVLSVFDARTYEHRADVDLDSGPINIVSDPAGDTAFVSNLHSGTVSVIDLRTHTRTATLTVPGPPPQGAHGLAYLP